MNRREFLELLGIGAVSVAAPKFIFDMGKNSRIYTPKYEAYKLYKIDDRLAIYQPNGSWFYGPGIVKVQGVLCGDQFKSIVVASTTAKIPVGSFY
jgi:hypothetical protein